jgi:hypothetical protein
VKHCLIDGKGEITINCVAMFQLSVQLVLDMMETEDHKPDSWRRWIEASLCSRSHDLISWLPSRRPQ